ncbi:transporter [Ectobacillus sp. sgz5001026]|uniref:transporter n=1 Tax=Ectobacillus sp. sgz5001026 TaxID=3242473 RepID=UPI0036D2A537
MYDPNWQYNRPQQSQPSAFPPYLPGQGGGYPPYPPGHGGGYPSYPPGQGGGYPSYPPGGGSMQAGPPQSPPPATIPPKPQLTTYAVDPGAIRRCLYRYTYVWLTTGRNFWFYPVFLGRDSIAGYRWSPSRYRWMYAGYDLRMIEHFECT